MNWRLAPGAGEGPLEDKLVVFAGLEAVFLEKGPDGGLKAAYVEEGLDGATVGPAADEGAVGAFAEDEVEGADEDGLAGAGFAGNDVVTGPELEGQVSHQGEILDAQGRQHVPSSGPNVARMAALGKGKVAGS